MKPPTSAEKALQSILEGLGYLVMPYADKTESDPANTVYMQMPLHRFTTDFALPYAQICLEADGERWHRGAKSKLRDRNRDVEIRQLGWQVLRFQATILEKHPDIAVSQVSRGVNELMLV